MLCSGAKMHDKASKGQRHTPLFLNSQFQLTLVLISGLHRCLMKLYAIPLKCRTYAAYDQKSNLKMLCVLWEEFLTFRLKLTSVQFRYGGCMSLTEQNLFHF